MGGNCPDMAEFSPKSAFSSSAWRATARSGLRVHVSAPPGDTTVSDGPSPLDHRAVVWRGGDDHREPQGLPIDERPFGEAIDGCRAKLPTPVIRHPDSINAACREELLEHRSGPAVSRRCRNGSNVVEPAHGFLRRQMPVVFEQQHYRGLDRDG